MRQKIRYEGTAAGALAAQVGPLRRVRRGRARASAEPERSADLQSAEAPDRFETVYRNSPMGIGLLDFDAVWIDTNEAMRQITGYSADELSRTPLRERVHPDDWKQLVALSTALRKGEIDFYRIEIRSLHKDGQVVWTDSLNTLARDENGKPAFQIVMSQDITQRKLAELALAETTARLATIVETQREASVLGADVHQVARLIARRAQELTGAAGVLVDVLEGIEHVTVAATGAAEVEREPRRYRSHLQVPIVQGEQELGHLGIVDPEPGAFGEDDRQTLELLAVVLSSAVSRAAELAAKRQQLDALARFETVYRDSPMGIGLFGLDGVWLETNEAMRQINGYSAEELKHVPLASRIHPDDLDDLLASYEAMVRGDIDTFRCEVRSYHQDGHLLWTDSLTTLVRDENGQPSFAIVMSQNITQRKEAEEELLRQAELNEHQALHDGLTGLANRSLFRERIEQAIRDVERNGGSAAVLMMDLDRFKEVNDSLGHHAGDLVLSELGRRLANVLRASDGAARIGGDEFGFLAVKLAGPDDVTRVIRRIQGALEQPFVVHGLSLTVAASIGVAFYPRDGNDVDALLRRADAAMYVAKAERSGYAVYDEVAASGRLGVRPQSWASPPGQVSESR